MKYLLFPILLLFVSCGYRNDPKPGFDVDAMVHRSSLDTGKGIVIQVFPMDIPDKGVGIK
jgi:hypothetical protein